MGIMGRANEFHVSHVLNYTGHKLVLICASGEQHWLPSRGIARLDSDMTTENKVWWDSVFAGSTIPSMPHLPAIPILEITERQIIGLPEPDNEHFYVVSGVVAAAARRDDVLCPGRMIRGEGGKIIGCGALIRVRQEI